MNSQDGSNPSDPQRPQGARPRLHIGGDASGQQFADRASTVMVHADDPTPPPTSMGPPAERFTPAPGSMGPPAERFTPAPTFTQPQPRVSTTGPHIPYGSLGSDEPTPPPGQAYFTGPHQPAPQAHPGQSFYSTGPQQRVSQPYGTGQHQRVQPRSAYDLEHITSTGFIPPTNFQPSAGGGKTTGSMPKVGAAKKEVSPGKFKINISGLTWLDDTAQIKRLQYGGGGFLAGAFAGLILGIINAALQGWEVVDGLGQLLFLAIFVGIVVAIVAAMRPERIDELLSQISFFSDRDNNED